MSDTNREPKQVSEEAAAQDPTAATATAAAATEALAPPRYRAQDRVVVALLVAAIAVALVFMGWYVRQHASALLPRAVQPLAQKAGLIEKPPEMKIAAPIGSPQAKVKAVVVMEHCLIPLQDLLVKICTEYPELVCAEFVSMYSPEGQKVMQDHQETCAGAFINDRNRFRVALPGEEEREVRLHGLPGSEYRLSHVVAVVRQEIAGAYGAAPADFDQRIQVAESPAPIMGVPGGTGPHAGSPPPEGH